MIATGVARPRAQGQLITRTEIPLATAKPTVSPRKSQTRNVITEIVITAGTKIPETLSATFAMGAFVAAAPSTIFIIWERVVSSPTLVASHFMNPLWFIVAAETEEPIVLSTGTLSPVRADSLTAVSPSRIIPSTGMLSPGRTTKISPLRTSSIPTEISSPSRITDAVLGARFIRERRASVVFPFERASSIFPTVMSARIIAADSK